MKRELSFFFLPQHCSINKWQNFMFTHKMFWFPADDSIREKTALVGDMGFEYIPLDGILENHFRGLRRQDWGQCREELRTWRYMTSETRIYSFGDSVLSMVPCELATGVRVLGSCLAFSHPGKYVFPPGGVLNDLCIKKSQGMGCLGTTGEDCVNKTSSSVASHSVHQRQGPDTGAHHASAA